jgi:hypothetical protein
MIYTSGELTGQWYQGLIAPCIAPLEYSKGLAHGESTRGIFERDDTFLARDELGDIGMLLELEVGAKVGGGGRERELDVR